MKELVVNLIIYLPLIPPPLALLWMIYRDIRYTDWTYFGIALGVLASLPVAGYFWIWGSVALLSSGTGLWLFAAASLIELIFAAIGYYIENRFWRRKSKTAASRHTSWFAAWFLALSSCLVAGQKVIAQDLDNGWAAFDRADFKAALREWQPLAGLGEAEAQFGIGLLYHLGKGVAKDDTEAARWFQFSAQQGLATAQFSLGVLYDYGLGIAEDDALAGKWYLSAAEKGLPLAQINLGFMYAAGEGVAEDSEKAVRWYRLASESGSSDALVVLPFMYEFQADVSEINDKAETMYRLAAAQGIPSAQHNLGVMYDYAIGVAKSDAEASRWYRRAAHQGYAKAQQSLGVLYLLGEGVRRDLVSAHMWLSLAETNDYKPARNKRRMLEKRMTSADIKRAQERARKCIDTNYIDCE